MKITLPKKIKIFLYSFTAIFALLFLGIFTLQFFVSGKVESADFYLKESNPPIYKAQIDFKKLKFLVRSKNLAQVEIQDISWEITAPPPPEIQGRNLQFETEENLQNLIDQKIGHFTYTVNFSPIFKTLTNYYCNVVFLSLILQILWAIFNHIRHSLPSPKIAEKQSLIQKDRIFLMLSFVICFAFCAFHFWLGFPGYIWDGDIFSALSLNKNNWHPIITAYTLEILFAIFGKHIYFIFLMNCITLYVGIWFFIAGFYLRFRSIFSFAIVAIILIGNITLGNFIAMNYILMANFIFCAYAIIFFLISSNNFLKKRIQKMLWIFVFVLLFLAILWRHNAIFSVFPVFFILAYLFLENRGLSIQNFFKRYSVLMLLSAVLCLSVVVGFPKLLAAGSSPQNHLLLSQIAGACVPAGDSACFKKEWFQAGKSFEDVRRVYQNEPLNGDNFACWFGNAQIFSCEINGVGAAWLAAITKYPANFAQHEARFFSAMWLQNPRDDDAAGWVKSVVKTPENIQQKPLPLWKKTLQNFPENEWQIAFSPLQEKIYTTLYENLPVFSHIVFVAIAFVVLALAAVFWAMRFKTNAFLVFAFSASFSAFASAVIIAGMAIVSHSRYMSPIPILSITALIAFLAWILSLKHKIPR